MAGAAAKALKLVEPAGNPFGSTPFDRRHREFETVGNFFIGQPLGDQRQDFFLSVGELPIAAL